MGTSERDLYGDLIQKINWSVGPILVYLKAEGLDRNTLVLIKSDNGPWALLKEQGGSSGLLYGPKGTSYEGGVREPALFWWPGKINPAVISEMGSTLDILPTLYQLAGSTLPEHRIYDG